MTAPCRITSIEHIAGRTITHHAEGTDFDEAIEALRKLRAGAAERIAVADDGGAVHKVFEMGTR